MNPTWRPQRSYLTRDGAVSPRNGRKLAIFWATADYLPRGVEHVIEHILDPPTPPLVPHLLELEQLHTVTNEDGSRVLHLLIRPNVYLPGTQRAAYTEPMVEGLTVKCTWPAFLRISRDIQRVGAVATACGTSPSPAQLASVCKVEWEVVGGTIIGNVRAAR